MHPGGEQCHPISVVGEEVACCPRHFGDDSLKSQSSEVIAHSYCGVDSVLYLIFAQASCDETIDHLETLFETGSLTDEVLYNELHARLDTLGRKINAFIQAIEKSHKA